MPKIFADNSQRYLLHSYYLLYKAKVPSVMVECGFMSNIKENNQLKQDVYRRRVAFCILAGLSDTMKTGELP